MTPPRSITGAAARLFRNRTQRRIAFVLVVAVLGLLALFPERHRAAMTVTPTDPSALGLQGALGQLGALNTVFGNQAAIEIALKVARSQEVRGVVAKKLDLSRRLGMSDEIATDRWLTRKVTIRSLRGGIIQVELMLSDAELARTIVTAFSDALRERLAVIAREQTAYKRKVLEELVSEASERLAKAEQTYDSFRIREGYTEPNYAIQTFAARIEALRAGIKGKELELAAASQFATEENMRIRDIRAQMAALEQQMREAEAERASLAADTVGGQVQKSTHLVKLERELAIARGLYDSYSRFLEGTSVEDLTSTANVRMLEAPFVDTARQYNVVPLAIGVLVLLLGLAIEFYELRPPVGDRAVPRNQES